MAKYDMQLLLVRTWLLFSCGSQIVANSDYLFIMLNTLRSNIPTKGVDHVSLLIQDGILTDFDLNLIAGVLNTKKQIMPPDYMIGFEMMTNNNTDNINCSNTNEKGYNVLISGNNFTNVANLINKDYEQNKKSIWLLPSTEEIIMALRNIHTPIDSHIYLVNADYQLLDNGTIELSEVYQVREDKPMLTINLGTGENIVQQSEDGIWSRRTNLQGITWKVGLLAAIPYTLKDKDDNTFYGFTPELWSLIAKNLNISSEVTEFENFGSSVDGIKWNGIVGAIQRGTIDVSMTPMSHSVMRAAAVDYISPVDDMIHSLATFVTADGAADQINIFDNVTYFVIVLLFLVSWLASIIILKNKQTWNSNKSELALLSLGSFVSQGMDQKHLETLSQRVLFYTKFLCNILMLAFFSANLTSTLAVKEISSKVENLQDVYDLGLNLYTHGGGSIESNFRNARVGVWHNLWRDQISKDPKFYAKREDIFQNFKQDPKGVLFIQSDLLLHNIKLDNSACGLHIQTIRRTSFAMPVKKRFPYKNLIDYQIEKMKEIGVLDQIKKRHLRPLTKELFYICSDQQSTHLTRITFENVQALFVLMCFGVTAGASVALVEYLLNMMK